MKPTKLQKGDRVQRSQGCRLRGIVLGDWGALLRMGYNRTDGSYREPLNERERRDWLSVEWDDGTRGYCSRLHLEPIPESERERDLLRALYGAASGSGAAARIVGNPYCHPIVRTVGKYLGDLK